MSHDVSPPYRTPNVDPDPTATTGPREDLGQAEVPVVGTVAGEVRLDRPFHVELDRKAAVVRPAGGLVLRSEGLPTVDVQALHVDLVDGIVRTEAGALGAFFDRVLTVALCSGLRQSVGWRPGTSAAGPVGKRLPRSRRRFPRTSVALAEDTRIEIDVAGDAATVTLSRPGLLRFLGLPIKVSTLRYDFANAAITAHSQGVGPVRRGILRLMAWGATRWLRPRLPAALRRPGYDLFADEQRRTHLQALVARLRSQPDAGPEEMGAGTGRPGHELARAGEGRKAGMFGLFSASKAAIAAALLSLRITADDLPARTRVLVRLPLGPLSKLALCTDRGGEVVVSKYQGGLRLDAPLGIYLFADQFPELAELRLTRVVVDLSRKHEVDLDIQTEPPLGPLARALLHRVVKSQVRPRVPTERLAAAGVWDEGPEHVVLRQALGGDRSFTMRTPRGAELRLRDRDEELVLEAPEGLEALFAGVPVPNATVKQIVYRREDGSIRFDGSPGLDGFGERVAAALMRVRGAPHLPRGVEKREHEVEKLDPERLAQFSVTIASLPLPLLGKFELRMDPRDRVEVGIGPALVTCSSELGLLLVAQELDLALQVKGARYDLASKAMVLDASPAPGPYLSALAGMCLEALLVPLLRKALPLAPDVDASARWILLDRFGVRVSLPPGASLLARRTAEGLELAGSEAFEVDGQGGPVADFTVERVRWIAAEDRIVVDSVPSCGPLLGGVARRVLDRLIPDFIANNVTKRLGLPAPKRQEEEPAPTMPSLFEREVSTLGPLALFVDAHRGMTLRMRQEGGELQFGSGAILRAERFGAQLAVHRVAATFLPFTLAVTSEPATGELEDHLLAQVARVLLAPAMRMLWPADRPSRGGRDVLLAIGADSSWGPLELCVPPGGEVELHLDHEGIALTSPAGVFVAGIDFLPEAGVHALRVRFEDGAVELEVGEIAERYYHEALRVSPTSLEVARRLLTVYVTPHLPAWAQRLGMRVLPLPKPLPEEPGRKLVWQSQLPGGLAKLAVRMDPLDLLELRATRIEVAFTSELGLHLDLENLGLRLPVFQARYHMVSGELQLGELGQLENAVAEGLVRKALATMDTTAAPDEITLLDVLDRFPLEDGKRILFGDKVVQVRMDPEAVIILRLNTEGLVMTVDPPVEIDGPAVLNFVFHGLRYDFKEGEFHIDWKHDGVISRLFSGATRKEGEGLLNSLRPALPAAMRRPGYSLASDPDPGATLGHLVRTVSRRRAAPSE